MTPGDRFGAWLDAPASAPALLPATVTRVIDEAELCRSFEFTLDDGSALRSLAGQFVTVSIALEPGVREQRSYSLSSLATAGERPCFTVKAVSNGRVSGWLHRNFVEGTRFLVSRPMGRFTVAPGANRLLFIAAGSGITPIYPMLREALRATNRHVTLLAVHRKQAQAIFRAGLHRMLDAHADRLTLFEVFTGEAPRGVRDSLAAALPAGSDADVYLCGPAGFVDLVRDQARAAGLEDDRVLVERFVAEAAGRGFAPPPGFGQAAEITAQLGGATTCFSCAAGQTILDAALAAGVAAPSSCREGHCGACIVRLEDGTVDSAATAGLSRRDRSRRFILACQARPTSPAVRVSYDG